MTAATRIARVPPNAARSALARAWLGAPAPTPADERLGTVHLRPHQLAALGLLRRALDDFGGALLADAVGLGKTYVALALARDARRPIVVAPAALRATWHRAAAAGGVAIPFVSFETLGRAAPRSRLPEHAAPDLVVVDEAHHARNPATRRYHALATLAHGARVLLLTATPVHNHTRDLHALLALFLGARAPSLARDALDRLVVRRTARDVARYDPGSRDAIPTVHPTRWLPLPDTPPVLHALRAVPPPLPPRDGGVAHALAPLTLVQCWASSDAALRAALRRRLARAAALAAALEQGRHLTGADLRRWAAADDAVQLELALGDDPIAPDPARLAAAIRAHEAGVRHALETLARAGDARDASRVAHLRDVRRRHPDARVVAFTRSADTARALFSRLAPDGGVAVLTARGGTVAGGPIARRDVLARFAPAASGLPPPRASERIDLLLATDCLSEGLDLHDASVVVHLDIPWTPARLAQRVGRAARLGSTHSAVAVYAIRPPGGAAAWLRLGARHRAKTDAARAALGMPHRGPAPRAPPHTRIAAHLERWAKFPPPPATSLDRLLVAAVPCRTPGFLALCLEDGRPLLVAAERRRVSATPRAVARAIVRADGADGADGDDRADGGSPDATAARAALRRLRRWLRRRAAARLARAGRDDDAGDRCRRAVVARAARIVAAAPAHRRRELAPLVGALRDAAGRPWGAAAESAVGCAADLPDLAWLRAVAAALDPAPGRPSGSAASRGVDHRIVTMLVLGA